VGLLFKIVIISIVLLYIVTKVGGFIFRNVYWLLGNEAVRRQQEQAKANPRRSYRNRGNVRVDYAQEPNGQRRPAGRHDGEYVDYEEVK
jgi:flagellar basal body-associated protein FliL